MSLSSYIMPSPNWLCDMIKNEVTLSTTTKPIIVSVVRNSSQEICMGVFKGQGFGCGGGGESGTTMGPVFMLNGSVVVMLVRLPKDNSNAS
uniref:Uncharacterized protein n=1 Tax=Salix viminalis TaxID=40686 RepID=A0A6N2M298_SALVM